QRAIEGLETLIEKYKADKKALHLESPCSVRALNRSASHARGPFHTRKQPRRCSRWRRAPLIPKLLLASLVPLISRTRLASCRPHRHSNPKTSSPSNKAVLNPNCAPALP